MFYMEIKKGLMLVFGMIFVLGLIGFSSAVDVSELTCENALNYKEQIVGNEIPSEAPFNDEIINVYISNETYGNLVIEESVIKDFSCVENEDASYEIRIKDLQTMKDFVESEDFIQTYKDMKKSGDLEIKGIGFGKKIKLAFVNFVLKFF